MTADRKKKAYTLYSLVRLLFDEAALVAVVLLLLEVWHKHSCLAPYCVHGGVGCLFLLDF